MAIIETSGTVEGKEKQPNRQRKPYHYPILKPYGKLSMVTNSGMTGNEPPGTPGSV